MGNLFRVVSNLNQDTAWGAHYWFFKSSNYLM